MRSALAAWFDGYRALPRTVHVLCLGGFVNRAGTMMMPYMALYLSSELGFSRAIATSSLGAAGAGSMVASMVGGVLADRIGRRPVMLMALFGGAMMALLLSLFRAEAALLAAIFGFAAISDMYRPASQAMVSDVVEESQRPRAFALLYVAHNLGFATGISLGGVLAARSFQYLFWGDALSSAAFALWILWTIAETKPASIHKERPEISTLAAAKLILRDRTFMTFAAAHTLVGSVFAQAGSTLPLYVQDQGLGPDRYGQIMAVNGVMIVALQLPITHWAERRSRAWILAAGSLLVGLGFCLNIFPTTTLGFMAALVVWTIGEILLASSGQAVVAALAPEALRARYFGAFVLSFNLSMLLAPAAGGWALTHLGGAALWGLSLGFGIASALGMLSVRRGLDRGRSTGVRGGEVSAAPEL
ncbi:MAG: MFS transporter [Myxococcota bacterium]